MPCEDAWAWRLGVLPIRVRGTLDNGASECGRVVVLDRARLGSFFRLSGDEQFHKALLTWRLRSFFAFRKLGSFDIIRSGVSLSGSRVKPGISALLRGQASGARLVLFFRARQDDHFHMSLLSLSLCSFLSFENWFRFTFFGSASRVLRCAFEIGFGWVCIGQVSIVYLLF